MIIIAIDFFDAMRSPDPAIMITPVALWAVSSSQRPGRDVISSRAADHLSTRQMARSMNPSEFMAIRVNRCEHCVKRRRRAHKYFACYLPVLEQTELRSHLDPAARRPSPLIGENAGGHKWAR